MKVIIQKDIYQKGQLVFDKSGMELFIFERTDSEGMLRCQKQTKAKCFILGADSYAESFFNQLQEKSLIARFGVGYDAIPLDICKKRNISFLLLPVHWMIPSPNWRLALC